ncbi:MAG: M20/M25/M40 family metallo-hydrolase [Candidatus Latescibacteria bacterium]|nr:M20/M25/M40 family metallo-hydrolase [Candidatus Latescibacterota bacterium]NIM22515.1 M20/M25/M40 family metallo-hydrolase [Candidatus Latescibacterota bacterium]NIM64829.1 M20/M25/M40 family metallo-hydrolase [Candidatus Latescibacterota bacterium]NIO01337.1 M20/M25/M40 family metallo-hydrolase [Candidatus Latescibacterota bacterium]NIO27826.1 M20/M25/M40 family metallo-hydrolase [Candidatus Latescibacterota bacterium]
MPYKSQGLLNYGGSSKPHTTGFTRSPVEAAFPLILLLWALVTIKPSFAEPRLGASPDSLKKTVSKLSSFGTRFTWTPQADSAAFYLKNRCEALGLPARLDTVSYRSGMWRRTFNVVAEITGSDPGQGKVILGAHYDSIDNSSYSDSLAPAPGADDNGTGCAALLEIARVIKDLPLERTIEIVFFGAEEIGRWGSIFHAEQASAKGDSIVAMLSLDAIGYDADARKDVQIRYIDEDSGWLAEAGVVAFDAIRSSTFAEAVKPSSSPYESVSDHVSFWEQGFVAVHVFEGTNDSNPYINSEGDSISLVDFDYVVETTEAVAYLVAVTLGGASTMTPKGVFTVLPAYPNPFKDVITIRFDIHRESVVTVDVYGPQGEIVERIFHGVLAQDSHAKTWDGSGLGRERVASGVYFIRISAQGQTETAKAVLIR